MFVTSACASCYPKLGRPPTSSLKQQLDTSCAEFRGFMHPMNVMMAQLAYTMLLPRMPHQSLCCLLQAVQTLQRPARHHHSFISTFVLLFMMSPVSLADQTNQGHTLHAGTIKTRASSPSQQLQAASQTQTRPTLPRPPPSCTARQVLLPMQDSIQATPDGMALHGRLHCYPLMPLITAGLAVPGDAIPGC